MARAVDIIAANGVENAAITDGRVRLNGAYTNRLPNAAMSGSSLGVVGSGGSFPTDWINLGNSIPKTIVSIGTGRVAWTVPARAGVE